MQTHSVFKSRHYPSLLQKNILLQWIGCQRFSYNAKSPVDQQYIRYFAPKLTPCRKDVSSHGLRNGAVKWMQAYNRFFPGVSGRTVIKKKIGRQAVWLTSEPSRLLGNRLTTGKNGSPYKTSQDCAECWHVHPDNRPTTTTAHVVF